MCNLTHSYPACSLHLNLNLEDREDDMTAFVDDLYQFLSHEQKPHGLPWARSMGVATSAKTKTQLKGLSSRFEAYWSEVFSANLTDTLGYELLRCLKVEIWQFSWWQTTNKTDFFIPCTCAWGNNSETLCPDREWTSVQSIYMYMTFPKHWK